MIAYPHCTRFIFFYTQTPSPYKIDSRSFPDHKTLTIHIIPYSNILMAGSTEYKTYTKITTIRIKNDLTRKSSSSKTTVKTTINTNVKTIKHEVDKRWNCLPLSSRKLYSH